MQQAVDSLTDNYLFRRKIGQMNRQRPLEISSDDEMKSDDVKVEWKASEVPIISSDGLLIRCRLCGSSYIPEEIIDPDAFVNMLVDELEEATNAQYKEVFSELIEHEPSRRFSTPRSKSVSTIDRNVIDQLGESHPHPHPKLRRRKISTPERPSWMRKTSREASLAQSVLLKISESHEKLCTDVNANIPVYYDEQNLAQLRLKFEDQINWLNKGDGGYVAMETMRSLEEFKVLLSVIRSTRLPIALQVRFDHDKTLTVVYQAVDRFRQDFMMLKVNENYCLFLEPF